MSNTTTDTPAESDEARLDELLAAMNLQEKVALCAGENFWQTRSVERLGIKRLKLTDGPKGIAWHSSRKRGTAFPPGIALAACWDLDLARRFGEAVGEEARAAGCGVVLGPAVNICRTPLNGRTFEYLTEDPHLNAKLAVPMVTGIQSNGIAACIKHYAANNQEKYRMRTDVVVSERALREIYLPVFEAAIKEGDAWSVMAAYNGVQGLAACENPDLLTKKLRHEWGFRGFVVSDWFAVRRVSSGASGIKAGMNLEMPGKGSRYKIDAIEQALADDDLTEQDLDDNLRGLLRVMQLTGHLDQPIRAQTDAISTPGNRALAREIAATSMTLLKNDQQTLPLDATKLQKVAVLGPKAKKRNCLPLWGGSSAVWPEYEITPWQGLQEKLSGHCELVKSPAEADAVLLFLGLSHRPGQDSEVMDRRELSLPASQVKLLKKTVAQSPNTIVILVSGSPVAMDWADDVPAILQAWYPGMEGGRAIADVLFGDVNPSGKLPVTFPRQLSDSPAHASQRQYPGDGVSVYYDEDIFVGYRHFDTREITPLFPFGHGLSYTSFDYSGLTLSGDCMTGEETLQASLEVTNSGDHYGAEVVQLYLSAPGGSQPRALQELKGFERIALQPGEKATVTFQLQQRDLAFFDEASASWLTDSGDYVIRIGASSRDIRLHQGFSYRDPA